MGRVPIGRAKRLCIDNTVTAIRSKLGAELAAAISASDTPTIYCPAPEDEAVYRVERVNLEEVVRNHGVAVLVYPASPLRVTTEQSSGLNAYKATTETDVDVFLVFEWAIQATALTDVDGEELTREAEMVVREELYVEALVNTLLKYTWGAARVHDVRLRRNDTQTYYTEERQALYGAAYVGVTYTQLCNVPQRTTF